MTQSATMLNFLSLHAVNFHTSVLLENTPLVKFLRNYIRDSSGVFSISSLVRISMISLPQSWSLKLFFDSLVYIRNIFGSSSKVFGRIFGNLRESSEIFGKKVRHRSCDLRISFRESIIIFKGAVYKRSSESGRKSSENRQKRCNQEVYIIKRTLHVSSKI